HYDYSGRMPQRVGLNHPSISPYGAYPTRGNDILIAIQNEREFARLCAEVLEQPALPQDPRFATNESRVRHRAEIDAIVTTAFARIDRDTLIGRLKAAQIAFGEVNDVAGLSRHPALRRAEV